MKKLEANLNHVLEGITTLCFLAILVIVIALVVLRYAFNSSITGANELITVLFVYSTAIGAAVALGKREHITISAVAERLPRGLRRVIDTLGLLLVAALNGALVGYSIVWIRTTGDFLMPSTELPRMAAQLSIPLGSGLAVLYCLFRLARAVIGEEQLGESWTPEGESKKGSGPP